MSTARLAMVTLDCADPEEAAAFWSALLGPDHALGFGRVEGYVAPGWPNENGSKQFHFDLAVEDLDATQERAVELGAAVADPQPGETWRVLLDPAGHPFCLTKAENWG